MSKIDIISREWNDLVFEGRNKEYGGYLLRKTSDKRHVIALIIVVAVALVLFYSPKLFNILLTKAGEEVEQITERTVLVDLDKIEEEVQEQVQEVQVKQLQELRQTIQFTEFKAVDKEITDVIAASDIFETEAVVSSVTQEGTTNVEIPPDVHVQGPDTEGDDVVYDTFAVEQQPDFPGGMEALYKYLGKELRYPASMRDANIQGKIFVQFVVSKTGKITNVKIARGLSPAGDEEAIRVVEKMPNWIPGKQNGVPVSVTYILPITFTLKN
jgi:protein TonB